jgi:hypothetical protein
MKAKLLVMRGINHESALKAPMPPNHEPDNSSMLIARQCAGGGPGQTGGISIDQEIANAIGTQTRFASLQLGALVGSYCGIISSRGKGGGIQPDVSPYKAFARIFKDVTADPTELVRIRAERKSIMDALTAEIADLRCAVPGAERPKMDAHLDSIRELERSLDSAANGAKCAPPMQGAPVDLANANFPQILKLQMDVAVAALACDLTRVVTVQAANGATGNSFPWLNIGAGHHSIAHNEAGPAATCTEWTVQIETWYAQQFAYLAGKLDAIDDGGGTLLDHSAVLWGHEQSNGGTHLRKDMPWVLAGSARGAFHVGRALDVGGKPHNGLMISLANAMGVPLTAFGDPDFSNGPLADL